MAAWSDADGRFVAEIKLLWPQPGMPDPGTRSIMAVDKRRGCAIEDSIAVKPGTRSGVTLRFPRPATLTIEIVGADGEPRPGHWINVLRRIPAAESWTNTKMRPAFGANPPWLTGQRPVTDAEGRAVIDRLPPGDYDIHLKFHRRKLTLNAGEKKLLRVVRGAGPSISGRVLDENGQPVAGMMIGLSGPTNAIFTVLLSSASASNVTVNFASSNGTALAGLDYTANSGWTSRRTGAPSKSERGMVLIVRRFWVTSSPTEPSPRVAPWMNTPFS